MVHLYKTKNGIWDNYWPKHSAENTIDYKTDATNKIYNSNFAEVFQNKTQHNKKRGSVANIRCYFGSHNVILGQQT